jgi:hypothetical protein
MWNSRYTSQRFVQLMGFAYQIPYIQPAFYIDGGYLDGNKKGT